MIRLNLLSERPEVKRYESLGEAVIQDPDRRYRFTLTVKRSDKIDLLARKVYPYSILSLAGESLPGPIARVGSEAPPALDAGPPSGRLSPVEPLKTPTPVQGHSPVVAASNAAGAESGGGSGQSENAIGVTDRRSTGASCEVGSGVTAGRDPHIEGAA